MFSPQKTKCDQQPYALNLQNSWFAVSDKRDSLFFLNFNTTPSFAAEYMLREEKNIEICHVDHTMQQGTGSHK